MTDQTPGSTGPMSAGPDDASSGSPGSAGSPGSVESVESAGSAGSAAEVGEPSVSDGPSDPAPDDVAVADPLADALGLAETRLGDLLRERAEFVNYRRRVERDREVSAEQGKVAVLTAVLPVLDDIDGARTHGDLVGPFASVADKLDATLARLGLESFGEPGDAFDPALHEALLQDGATQVDVPTCTQVLQRGYRTGDRVLRPARVAVASPA